MSPYIMASGDSLVTFVEGQSNLTSSRRLTKLEKKAMMYINAYAWFMEGIVPIPVSLSTFDDTFMTSIMLTNGRRLVGSNWELQV